MRRAAPARGPTAVPVRSPRCATSPGPRGGDRGGAQVLRELLVQFARLGDPADPAREGVGKMPQVWPGAGAGPARRPPRCGLHSSPPPSAGGAGREHKRPNFRAGVGLPRQLPARQARPAERRRAGTPGRLGAGAGAGAGGPGRSIPGGGAEWRGRCERRGRELLRLPRLPEGPKEFLK